MNRAGLPLPVVEAGLQAMNDHLEANPETDPADAAAAGFATAIAVWRELEERRAACEERGRHEIELVEDPDGATPVAIVCQECGTTWDTVLSTVLPDVAVPASPSNGDRPPIRKSKAKKGAPIEAETPVEGASAEESSGPEVPSSSSSSSGRSSVRPADTPGPEESPETSPEMDQAAETESPVCESCGKPTGEHLATAVEVLGRTLCDACLLRCADCSGEITASGKRTAVEQVGLSHLRWRRPLCVACHQKAGTK